MDGKPAEDKFSKHMAINLARRRCLMNCVLVDRTASIEPDSQTEVVAAKNKVRRQLKHIERFFEEKEKTQGRAEALPHVKVYLDNFIGIFQSG